MSGNLRSSEASAWWAGLKERGDAAPRSPDSLRRGSWGAYVERARLPPGLCSVVSDALARPHHRRRRFLSVHERGEAAGTRIERMIDNRARRWA